MKCPRCTFVASNKKDVCPRCEFDLRPRKAELGIAVLHPHASLEELLKEQREASVKKTPLEPYAKEASGNAPSLWRKLFGKKPPPAPIPTTSASGAIVTTEAIKDSGPAKALPKIEHASKPLKSVVPQEKSPQAEKAPEVVLPIVVAAKGKLVSAETFFEEEPPTLPARSEAASVDGLDFRLEGEVFTAPVLNTSFSPPPTLDERPAPRRSPAHAEDEDFQELLRALEDMGEESSSTEDLFGSPIPEIDANLEDIIHALNEVAPENEPSEIELFQDKLEDIAMSLNTGVEEAKNAASSLLEESFPASPLAHLGAPSDEEEAEPAVDDSLFDDVDLDSLASELEELQVLTPNSIEEMDGESEDEPAAYEPEAEHEPSLFSTATGPNVSPEVIEFDENEEAFHQTLDAMIGDDILNVEAVKVQKQSAPSPSQDQPIVTDDGMEISFEFDLEGGEALEEAADVMPPENEHDAILAELLSTYEVLEQNIEHRSIAAEAKPELKDLDHDDAGLPQHALHSSFRQERSEPSEKAKALLDKLSFLSEDLLGELRTLLLHSPRAEAVLPAETAVTNSHDPLLNFEVAEKIKDFVVDSKNATSDEDLERLQAELGQQLQALQSEGLTIYSHEPLPQVESEGFAQAFEGSELPDLSRELDNEIEALEAEGLHVYHQEQSESEPVSAPVSSKLLDLSSELDNEIEALEAEGLHVYHQEQSESETVSAPVSEELLDLSSELDNEIQALEAEGLHVYHQEQSESETVPAPVSEELLDLSSELDNEIEALEAEGLHVYHQEQSEPETVSAPVSEELLDLSSELDNEIEALEAEGLHVYHQEQSEPEPVSAELSDLSSELDNEIEALEAEGLHVYHQEQSESEPLSAPVSEELLDLSSELDNEIEALEAEGLHVYHQEQSQPEPLSAELSDLSSELDNEIEALEAEGLHVYKEIDSLDTVPETSDAESLSSEFSNELQSDRTEGASLLGTETIEGELVSPEALLPSNDSSEAEQTLEELPETTSSEVEIQFSTQEQALSEELFSLAGYPPSENETLHECVSNDKTADAYEEDLFSAIPPTVDANALFDSEPPSENVEQALLATEAITEVTIEGLDDVPHNQILATPNEPSRFDDASLTGRFLARDLGRLVDLVAEESAETEEDILPPAPPAEELAAAPELDLSDLSKFFKITDDSAATVQETSKPEALDSALSTGVFLSSDLERILAEHRPANKISVAPELWSSALEEIRVAGVSREVELDLNELAPFHRRENLDVLFDLAREELLNPEGPRHSVTAIPTSVKTEVENTSLKSALSTFEKEEHVVQKRRARQASSPLVEDKKVRVLPASFLSRSVAALTDLIVNLTASAAILWFTVLPERVRSEIITADNSWFISSLPYMFQLLGLSYFIWLLTSTIFISGWGQTFGSQVSGIETVDANGKYPELKQALLRTLATSTTLVSLGLGFLPVLGKSKRAVHDQMSNTYVCKKRR